MVNTNLEQQMLQELFHLKIIILELKIFLLEFLKGHIAVASFKLKNSCGLEIDIAARKYLKK